MIILLIKHLQYSQIFYFRYYLQVKEKKKLLPIIEME